MKHHKCSEGLTEPQKRMIFILSMTLFGLSDLVTELIPNFRLGPIKLGISYFSFVSLSLVMLLHPFYAALGACFGEILFGDILMGDFDGLWEFESFIEYFIGMYIAGVIVKDPRNKASIVLASIVGVGIDQALSSIVDLGKIWIGIDQASYIKGFVHSATLLEALSFTKEMILSGVLLGVLPTLYFVPTLYGKIEPLLGINPREPK